MIVCAISAVVLFLAVLAMFKDSSRRDDAAFRAMEKELHMRHLDKVNHR